ncbi:hypothetical protein RIF29_34308 [Crotalaria pallida]|uniref:Uncharacterized protein n=1 Tax=Crotalaria pallida TaxID=3830 RepID=A0AAN9EEP4_CROPI
MVRTKNVNLHVRANNDSYRRNVMALCAAREVDMESGPSHTSSSPNIKEAEGSEQDVYIEGNDDDNENDDSQRYFPPNYLPKACCTSDLDGNELGILNRACKSDFDCVAWSDLPQEVAVIIDGSSLMPLIGISYKRINKRLFNAFSK